MLIAVLIGVLVAVLVAALQPSYDRASKLHSRLAFRTELPLT